MRTFALGRGLSRLLAATVACCTWIAVAAPARTSARKNDVALKAATAKAPKTGAEKKGYRRATASAAPSVRRAAKPSAPKPEEPAAKTSDSAFAESMAAASAPASEPALVANGLEGFSLQGPPDAAVNLDGSSGTSQPFESENPSWAHEFLIAPTKISTEYEVACRLDSLEGIRNNRGSIRIEYSKFFLKHLYMRIDAKVLAFFPEDHRSRATTLWLNDEPMESAVSFATLDREAYLQATLGSVSLKAGMQVPAWGEFEFVSVTDELSPLDFREPLVISLEALRLGQPMVTLDQYSVLGAISAFVIPYPLFNEHPAAGNVYSYDPFPGNLQVTPWERDPMEMEYGLRWKHDFDKTDVSLMAARLLENEQYLYMAGPGRLAKGAQTYTLAGASIDHAFSQVLVKAEAAAKLPQAFMDGNLQKAERNVYEAALGFVYTWDSKTNITVESKDSYIQDWSPDLQGVSENSFTVAGMLRRTFFNDDLSLTWISLANGPYMSYFHTLAAAYLLNDQITLSGEVLLPMSEDSRSFAYPLRHQKQFAARIRHQF